MSLILVNYKFHWWFIHEAPIAGDFITIERWVQTKLLFNIMKAMMIFSIKLPFSSSLAVDEEPKNDSLMSNLETNLASFDTGPPTISLLTLTWGWRIWMAESDVTSRARSWPAPSPGHQRSLHNVSLTCLTSYSLSGARELKVKLPANMTPSCLVTTCHTLN